MGLWGEWRLSLLSFRTFLLVMATLILAVTIQVMAAIIKKKNYFLLEVAEEVMATITVRQLFSFRGLTNQWISVII
jgi:hypothetical protein